MTITAKVAAFHACYREHILALRQADPGILADDTPINSGHLIRDYQLWLETNCVNFVDHTGPVVDGDGFKYFTLATWRAAAGLNSAGFRRDAGGYACGQPQNDDVVGDWIFADLAAGINALKWSPWTVNWTGKTDLNMWYSHNSAASWAAAKAAAEAAFLVNHTGPYAGTVMAYSQGDRASGFSYWAGVTRLYAWAIPILPFPIAVTSSHLYGKGVPVNGGTFDGNGDVTDTWALIAEDLTGSLSPEIKIGSTDIPAWVDQPVDFAPEIFKGYIMHTASEKWLVKWDFTQA